MKNNNKRYLIALLFIIVLAFVFRFYNLTKHPLWNDEAETSLHALQVLEVGYPHGYFRGEPMYENTLWLPSESDRYQYAQVNYQGSIYEKNKGWLPYYYLALVFKLFGTPTLTARLPFVFISLLSIIFIYLLGRELYSRKTGILASLFYAVNYLLIVNEQQARYYAFFVLLTLASLYFYQKLLSAGHKKYYWWLALSLILLFYTHIICWIIMIIFIAVHWLFIKKKQINLQWLISGLVILLLTLPWIFLVKFWTVFEFSLSTDLKIIWLMFIATLFSIYLIIKYFLEIFLKYKIKFSIKEFSLINLFILFYILIVPLFMPEESFQVRVFLQVIALLNLSLASHVIKLIHFRKIIKVIPVILLLFIFFETYIYFSYDNLVYYPDWIKQSINYLEDKKVAPNTTIYAGSQQNSFTFYTSYQVQHIAVLRKEYLDNYQDEFYIILNALRDYCLFRNKKLCQGEFLNYRDRIKKCDLKILDNETFIYHCPALN